jgi:hypothetical protein
LPSGVVGPVLFSALRRLASICLKELIEEQLEQLGSFRCGERLASRYWEPQILGASVPKDSWQFRAR